MNLKSYIKGRIISSFTLRICLSSPLLESFAAEMFPQKVPNDEERGKTVVFAGKIISFMLKYLDSVVMKFTHNYSSTTKICCRKWIPQLSSPATFTSKFCNKLSTQFKYLNSVIRLITDQTISNPSLLTDK